MSERSRAAEIGNILIGALANAVATSFICYVLTNDFWEGVFGSRNPFSQDPAGFTGIAIVFSVFGFAAGYAACKMLGGKPGPIARVKERKMVNEHLLSERDRVKEELDIRIRSLSPEWKGLMKVVVDNGFAICATSDWGYANTALKSMFMEEKVTNGLSRILPTRELKGIVPSSEYLFECAEQTIAERKVVGGTTPTWYGSESSDLCPFWWWFEEP